jgi:pimeloyl-ACP methyl ester carboxylesterase
VVLIHGLDVIGALSWTAVHDSIARTTRTCTYSRAGIMWSDPAPALTPQGMADDLHAALAAGGEHAPFVLVGHSLGGPISLIHTGAYGDEVAGLVMVDATHPDQLNRFRTIGITPENAGVRVLGIVAALSWTGVVRLAGGGGEPMPNQSMDASMAQRAWTPRSLGAAIAELRALEDILAAAATVQSLGDRPLVVLTAMRPMTEANREAAGITEEQASRQRDIWLELHREEAAWSTAGRQIVVPDVSHYIQFDRPDLVISSVVEVVNAVRARSDSSAPAQSPLPE